MSIVPPGPKGNFFLGSMNDFNNHTLKFLLDIRQYGDLASFKFGPFTLIMVNHPDGAHDVLVTQAAKYDKPAFNKKIMYPFLGEGLFISDGDLWKRQRRLMQPVFHTKRIGAYGQVMTDYAGDLGDEWQNGEVRHIDKDMTRLTMRIIAKTLFDADVSSEASDVSKAIHDALDLIEVGFKRLIPIPSWLPTAYNRQVKETAARLDKLIQRFIDDRRASTEDKGDLLSLLLAARDEDDNGAMTDKQVRDEAMTLFGAGHETTAVTMTWVWYVLSQYPDVEAKLHEELGRVLGGRLPTLDDLPNLTYTEKVIKETMRIFPAAFGATRDANQEVDLGGYHLKTQTPILINIYGMHHDSRFFPDPERFDPERFAPENEKNIPKYAYIPFSAGPRVCIGNAFSMMESRLILATLAQRFTLALAPGQVVEPDRQFTLRPKYGLQMVVKTRENIKELAH